MDLPNSQPSSKDIDAILHLPYFVFGHHAISPKHFKRLPRALGAVVGTLSRPRLGSQAIVIQKLTTVFDCAAKLLAAEPSLNELNQEFWTTLLKEIRKRDSSLSAGLDTKSLQHVVTIYQQAFYRGRSDALAQEAEKLELGGEDEGEGPKDIHMAEDGTAKKVKDVANPKEKLLEVVQKWYNLTHDLSISGQNKKDSANKSKKKASKPARDQNADESIEQLKKKLAQKDEDLARKDEELARKDEELDLMDKELADRIFRKNEELDEKFMEVIDKDEELIRKNEELARKDQELAHKNEELRRKNVELARSEALNAAGAALIETQAEMIEERERRCGVLEHRIGNLRERNDSLEDGLLQVYGMMTDLNRSSAGPRMALYGSQGDDETDDTDEDQ